MTNSSKSLIEYQRKVLICKEEDAVRTDIQMSSNKKPDKSKSLA